MRVVSILLSCVIAFVASAQEPATPVPGEPEAEAAPKVGLDQLLRLPNSFEADVDRRSGATASDWRARFERARKDIEDAKKRLAEIEVELKQASQTSSAWAVAAPGSSDPQASPLSLRLREEMRAERAQIEQGERELRALDVEADLAAVPPEWRQ